MTTIRIRNRELQEAGVDCLDEPMLDRLRGALRKKDTMGSPPLRLEQDPAGLLSIVAADLAEPEIERAKEWFFMEVIKARSNPETSAAEPHHS